MSKGTHMSVKKMRGCWQQENIRFTYQETLKSQEAILSNSFFVLSEVTTGYQ